MKVRSVFKYASPPPSNLCAATNISKSFPPCPPCALRPPFAPLPPCNRRWKGRKEDDSLPRESHDNNASGRSPRERQRGRGREGQRETDCEDAPSGQSGAGSRNIFENSNRLLETTGPARRRQRPRRHVSVDTEEGVRGNGPAGGGGGGERRERKRGLFSGPLSVDPDER